MKKALDSLSDDELVSAFVEIGTAQGLAAEEFRTGQFNRLFDKETRVLDELRRRDGDMRRVLIALYDHPNVQVRLNAAKSTYALNTAGARAIIEAIAASRMAPWAPSAGMTLVALDEGFGKLD